MRQLRAELERTARVARRWLAAQAICVAVTAMATALIVAGLVDYVLRLPGPLRLGIGLAAVGVGVAWLWRESKVIVGFRPTPAVLALRCERLDLRLAGQLASAVELADGPMDLAGGGLAAMSRGRVADMLRDADLPRLLDATRTLRLGALTTLALVVVLAVAMSAGEATRIAVHRWLLPLGDAQWPRRVQVLDMGQREVWPLDAPLRMRAAVTRGARPGLRVTLWHRRIGDGRPGPWQRQIMTRQDMAATGEVGMYEAILRQRDADDEAATGRDDSTWQIEYRFEAGDDVTSNQRITLAARPRLHRFTAEITPPPYAAAMAPRRTIEWDGRDMEEVRALIGSRVVLALEASRPLAPPRQEEDSWTAVLPGLLRGDAAPHDLTVEHDGAHLTVAFTLADDVSTAVHLRDELGLTGQTEGLFRLAAREDHPPTVVLESPSGQDLSVLAMAVVRVEAAARDDVALSEMSLVALPPTASDEAAPPTVLARQDLSQPEARLAYDLDLTRWSLRPGDQVVLLGEARDNYELEGQRHPAARSSPVVVQIIEPAALAGRLRRQLATMRRAVQQLEQRQLELLPAHSDGDLDAQLRLAEQVRRQRAIAADLATLLNRNRLEDPLLEGLIDQAGALLEAAGDAARQGAEADAVEQRSAARTRAAAKLGELAAWLDQGRDVLALQGELAALRRAQEELAHEAAAMSARTLGLDVEQLAQRDPQALEQLRQLAQRQADAAREAERLADRLHAAAEALARQSASPDDQAAAASLSEAAATAHREGLAMRMAAAAEQMRDNRLANAAADQQAAGRTLARMLDALARQPQRRQEILTRMLDDLRQAIAQLVEQQRAGIERLRIAEHLPPLTPALETLRRNTLAVGRQAAVDAEMQPAAGHLDDAVAAQGDALTALRTDAREPARTHQAAALHELEAALAWLDRHLEQMDQKSAQRQRQALADRYAALAERQGVLGRDTDAAMDEVNQAVLTRAQRRAMLELSRRQVEVRDAAGELESEVADAPLFEHLHRQVDEDAAHAAAALRAADTDGSLPRRQQRIAAALSAMAEALRIAADETYQRPLAGEDSGGAGGGGGGAAAEEDPARLMAELRLLRHMQQQVYDEAGNADADRASVAQQQRQVAELGRELAARLAAQQQSTQAPVRERHQ
jgi:hypothetical protein